MYTSSPRTALALPFPDPQRAIIVLTSLRDTAVGGNTA
ncbi:hypothetical protein DEDE109153_16420 [Deinococcus deserti]